MTVAPERSAKAGAHAVGTPRDVRDDVGNEVAARLRDPQVAASLATLLDHADLLAVLVEGLDQFVARSEVIGDSLLAGISELRSTTESSGALRGSALDLKALGAAGSRLASSGMLSADTVDQLAVIARGLARGRDSFVADPVEVKGPLSLLRLLKDPDVNRAVSYGATVLRAVGRELEADGSATTQTTT